VRIEGFTQPGDPLRLDYGYQNGVRGFIHSISLRRDIPQAKVLAYTAECIHARDSRAQITAITEVEPAGRQSTASICREDFCRAEHPDRSNEPGGGFRGRAALATELKLDRIKNSARSNYSSS
jgi:hypothetical protein